MKKLILTVLAIAMVALWAPQSFAATQTLGNATENLDQTGTGSVDGVNFVVGAAAGQGVINVSAIQPTVNSAGVRAAGIDAANDLAGTVNFAGTTTVSGATTSIGTNGAARIGTVNVNGASGTTVTLSSNSFVQTTNITSTGTLALNGNLTGNVTYGNGGNGTVNLAAAKSITGNVVATTAGEGNLTLGSGSTVTGNVGATRIGTLNATAGNATITGTVGATTISLGGNTLTEGGNLTIPASATVNLTANSATSYGNMAITGTITNNAATTFGVTVGGYIPNGATLNVLNASGGAPTAVTTTPTSSSPNVRFSTSVSGNDIILTATRVTAATSSSSSAVSGAIDTIGTPTGDMAVVLGQLDTLTSASAVDAAVSQMDPDVNAGVNAGSFMAVNQSIEALNSHLGEANTAANGTGAATGDFWKDNGIWAKGFGNHSDQDNRKGVNGYTANLWGVTGGMDGIIADNTRLGFSGGYSATGVDNKGDSGQTDIDSAQGTVYVGYDDPSPWYGNGGFSFNYNWYDGSREIAFGSINRTAKASYDGQQYTGFFDLGYVIKNMEMEKGQEWNFTPMAGLTYSHLDIDSYTETDAGALSLAVASQSYDLLQSSIGLKIDRPWTDSNGTFVPEIHGKWLYDYIGDKAATTATFTGGGSSFSTNGADPAQSSFDMGAGLTFYSKGNISVSGTYDFEIKEDFTSHTGQGVVRYTF